MSTRETNMYYFKNVIEKLFVDRLTFNNHGYMLTFRDLVTVGDWWSFMESILPEGIEQLANSSAEGGIFIGKPRLRQIRVRNKTCDIHEAFKNQFRTCYGKYSKDNEDVDKFLNKTHVGQKDLNTYTIWGKTSSYNGGGFIEKLSLYAHETEEIVTHLKDSNWIDRATRAVVIEFALFNANVNLLCNVKLLAEIPPSGGVLTSSTIRPVKYSLICDRYFERSWALIFSGLLLHYTYTIVLRIKINGFAFLFHSLWSTLDLIVVLIGYILLVYALWHTIYLKKLIDSRTISDPYFSLDTICHWNAYFVAVTGAAVYIAWIKMLKYIKLNKTMLQFSSTLSTCAKDFLGFAVMFAIVFVAYASLSVLLFGTIHPNFRDFSTAVLSMTRMIIGDFNYAEVDEANRVLGPLYFFSYVLFVFFILLNMFLAIIVNTYSNVKGSIRRGEGGNLRNYVQALVGKLKRYILPSKKSAKPVRESEESLMPSKPSAEEDNVAEKQKNSHKKPLDLWLQHKLAQRSPEEEEALIKRIVVLEESLDRLIDHLDEFLDEWNNSAVETYRFT